MSLCLPFLLTQPGGSGGGAESRHSGIVGEPLTPGRELEEEGKDRLCKEWSPLAFRKVSGSSQTKGGNSGAELRKSQQSL